MSEHFDQDYYDWNSQQNDRPALRWYANLVKRYFEKEKLLDFGCGTGTLIKRLNNICPTDGFEISKFAASQAAALNESSQIFTSTNDLTSKGFTSRYSGIVSIHVVEHLTDSELIEMVALWREILKEAGRIIIATPDYGGFAHRKLASNWEGFADSTHVNLKTSLEWDEFFARCGFRKVGSFTDGPWNGPYITGLRFERFLMQIPSAVQIFTSRKLIPCGLGESYVAIWEKEG